MTYDRSRVPHMDRRGLGAVDIDEPCAQPRRSWLQRLLARLTVWRAAC